MHAKRSFWIIFILAFGLRMAGLSYGLPHLYHQDEPIIVNHALAIGAGGWNTHFFVIPPFTAYFLFLSYAFYFAAGKLVGYFHDKTDFALLFLKDPSSFYLIGRFLLGAAFGTATVAVLAKLADRFFSRGIAVLAALFLSIAYLHAQHSHYIYADIPLTFAVAALFFYLLLWMDRPALSTIFTAGIILGWAVSIKYTAAYFVPGIFLAFAVVFERRVCSRQAVKTAGSFLAGSLLSFSVIAPYTFLDWKNFIDQVMRQSDAESPVGAFHHLIHSLGPGVGWVLLLLSALGIKSLWSRQKKFAIVLIASVGVYYLINAVFSQPYARYMLPIVPALSLLAAFGWQWLSEKLPGGTFFKNCFLAGILVSMLLPTVYSDILFVRKDTRTQCLEWFDKNAGQGDVVVMDNRFFGPPLGQTADQIKAKYELIERDKMGRVREKRLDLLLEASKGKKTYTVHTLTWPGAQKNPFLLSGPFIEARWEELKKINADYLVINYGEPNSTSRPFKDLIQDRLELAAAFSPYRDASKKLTQDKHGSTAAPHYWKELFSRERLGPYLEVYRVKR